MKERMPVVRKAAAPDSVLGHGRRRSTRGSTLTAVIVIGLLAGANVLAHFGPRHTTLILGPVLAFSLLVVARRTGLSWDEVGLDPRKMRRGAKYAAVSAACVAGVYTVAAVLPGVRLAFVDDRYRLGSAQTLVVAFVVIPLGTVLLEEVAFRGVLWGLIRRAHGAARATIVSSVLFGLWHILPSLRLAETNRALDSAVGGSAMGQVLSVGGAVLFTAMAGVVLAELRRRSGSLLAPAGLHWAANGLGLIVSMALALVGL